MCLLLKVPRVESVSVEKLKRVTNIYFFTKMSMQPEKYLI